MTMTRSEALAAVKLFLPTNPTHPSTHVNFPLEAVKVLIAATEALERWDVVMKTLEEDIK